LRAFRLYGTSACHLCELAQEMVEAVQPRRRDSVVEKIDISASENLFERYGEQIPVLQHPDGRELRWPFTTGELVEFLQS